MSPTPVEPMTPAKHLAEAERVLGDPRSNSVLTGDGLFADARKHLEEIPAGSPESVKAKRLMIEVKLREAKRAADRQRWEANEAADRRVQIARDRVQIARDMEIGFLEKGMDVHVSVHGAAKTTLTLEYVLISRPLLYRLIKEGAFDAARKAGFKKVILTNGYDLTWTMPIE